MNFKQNKAIWFIVAVFLLLTVISSLSNIITESWWFSAVNFVEVFWTVITWKIIVWIGSFILFAAFLWINYRVANRLTKNKPFRQFQNSDIKMPGQKIFNYIVGALILVISFIAAGATLPSWETILKFMNPSSFGTVDPIFGKDIGFYFFQLPFYNGAQSWLLSLFLLGLLLSGAVYFLKGAIRFVKSRQNIFSGGVQTHISLLLVGIAILIATRFFLDRYDLLFSSSGVVYGAGYTDVHAKLLSYWVMALLTIGVAVLFIISVIRKGVNLLISGVAVFVIALVLVNGIYPWFQQQFVVEPNELDRERPYIKYNIEFTRNAYDLHDVQRKNYPVESNLNQEVLAENEPTMQNVRLWDTRPLLSTYRQLQEIRLYYTFQDVDIDRYLIDGDYRQVMLSAREFNYNQVPTRAQTWQNQRLTYTHGYGAVMSPVNIVTEEGLPDLFIKNIPPVSEADFNITRPAIYYGEVSNYHIFTGTTEQEFDYPMGDENKYTQYSGNGGVPMGSLWRRLLYAYEFSSLKVVISDYFTEDSRVHYHREIRERVQNVAPFLHYDSDPYITIINGGLKWIIDAYTLSSNYPYAEPMIRGNANYIRNSVKVVVDAYDGTMKFYVVDETDPLLQTYRKIFPNLFTAKSEIPTEIQKHFRYPTDLFEVQSQVYLSYHMTEPDVFYNQEDKWEYPTEVYEGNEKRVEPYYLIMELPEERGEEFILIYPFTPVNKDNMIAWLAGRSDGEHYGELLLYEFPKSELIYGPMQIEARIDQNSQISELLTLWSQQGSRVIRGNLLAIPIEKSLLYVEPLFMRSDQGEIPELRRIILSYDNQIVMEETLDEALAVLFGEKRPTPVVDQRAAASTSVIQNLNISDMAKSALETYRQAQQSLQQGNWAEYGDRWNKLEDLLRQMRDNTAPGDSAPQE
ncbi:MAG: UPF0182 family protein [Candidatus Marinimicrobia bacterium]|nr:UPF0182 family protein [Candidatus Neomarinimicrobiota bacterium]MCF7827809.1 UPF0182 family protein [Candidatus Neomarinimicrobiota bacterium]MCF7879436.1 UPF0182 family protein [Candidatus Neomarinimicrobiota bacterium]